MTHPHEHNRPAGFQWCGAREEFACDRVEARREFPHLLRLVKASALLHFRQRGRDDNGRVVAERADYELAARLIQGPLGLARGGLSAAAAAFFERLRERFETFTFTTNVAREHETAKRRTVYGWLEELSDAGVVEQTEPQRGRVPATWRLTGRTPADAPGVVPPVDAVFPDLGGTHAHGA